jgi:hypothetical protein
MTQSETDAPHDTPVVVLGMHRSGTSLAAQLVRACGWHLGDDDELLGPRTDNADGFFERADVQLLNDQVLAEAASAWWDPPLTQELPDNPGLVSEIMKIVDGIASQAGGRRFAIKDPRIAILWHYWGEVLPDARILLAVRHPIEAASSLHARDGLPMEVGLALWRAYTEASISAALGRDSYVLGYEDVVTAPDGSVARLAQWLGVDAPPDLGRLAVKPQLRHHVASASEYPLTQAQLALWEHVQALAGHTLSVDASPSTWPDTCELATLARHRVEADAGADPLLRRATTSRVLLADGIGRISRLSTAAAAQEEEAATVRDQLAAARRRITGHEVRNQALTAALASAEARADALSTSLSEARDTISRQSDASAVLSEQLRKAEEKISDMRSELSTSSQLTEELRKRRITQARALEATSETLSERTAELHLARESEHALRASAARDSRARRAKELEVEVLEFQLAQSLSALVDTYERSVTTRETLEWVMGSRAWRMGRVLTFGGLRHRGAT